MYHLHKKQKNDMNKRIMESSLSQNKKMNEYKKDIKEIEDGVYSQMYLLQRDISLTDEEKLKGKIISSNTFMDLKMNIY